MQPFIEASSQFFLNILSEDLGIGGDITSNALIDDNLEVNFKISARNDLVVCGIDIAKWYFKKFGINEFKCDFRDGQKISKGTAIIYGKSNARTLFMLERVILNFMQHLSGVASLTNLFVNETYGTKAIITDTRKTLPGLRMFQKYAVTCGGGKNHRLSLDSTIMIKDNHIAASGGLEQAINKAQSSNHHYAKVIVECDTLEQVEEALKFNTEIILLDNMSVDMLVNAVKINNNRAILEASGGVNLGNVKAIANTGVDYIAIGQLTHSAPAVDIGIDIN